MPRWATVVVALLAAAGCSRRDRVGPDPATVHDAADAAVGPTLRRRVSGAHELSCVATDALYVRIEGKLLRFEGDAPPSELTVPGTFASTTSWTARAGWLAWTESNGSVSTWSTTAQRSGPTFRTMNDGDVPPLMLSSRHLLYITNRPHCAGPGAESCPSGDDLELGDLATGSTRWIGLDFVVDIRGVAVQGERIVVAHDFRLIDPKLSTASLDEPDAGFVKTHEMARPSAVPASITFDGHAAYALVEGELVRFEPTDGGATKVLWRPPPTGAARTVFYNDGALVLTVLEKGRDTLRVLDPSDGRMRFNVETKSSVASAFITRQGLAWCQSDGVFTIRRNAAGGE